MEKTYVTQMLWGYGDCTDHIILYSGTDYEMAKQKAIDFVFPDPYQNWGIVEHWENGKCLRREIVRE